MPEAYEEQLGFWRWVRLKKKKKCRAVCHAVSSSRNPSLISPSSLSARNCIHHLMEQHHGVKADRRPSASSVHTGGHMHADTSVSPLCLSGTTPSTRHPDSLLTHSLQHTYGARVSSKRWVETASSRSLQEKEGATEVARWLLQQRT